MSTSLDGKLVVAISSRALFDFEEENLVFEQSDDRAYMALQLQRLDTPAKPGVAFSLVKKLLAFNQTPADAATDWLRKLRRVFMAWNKRDNPSSLSFLTKSLQRIFASGKPLFTPSSSGILSVLASRPVAGISLASSA